MQEQIEGGLAIGNGASGIAEEPMNMETIGGRRLDEGIWVGEQLRKRALPSELAPLFNGCGKDEALLGMDAIHKSIGQSVETGIRKRIAGTAPTVGSGIAAQPKIIRRAFGLK